MAAAPEQHPRRPPPPAAIRVLDTYLVHPSPPSSDSDPPAPPQETSLPLTFFDIFWLHDPPVQRVLFYRLAPDADVDAVLSNLRRSLSHALRAFFPLAGRLRLAPGTTNRYELHYRPGDAAVTFTVAEYDGCDFDSLAAVDDDEPREVAKVAPLAPPLPEGGAVLAVQATVLLSSSAAQRRGGLAIGVTVQHTACDGAASTHFLHTWSAAACTGGARPPPPVIDRTLISDPRRLYDAFCPAAAPTNTDEMEELVDKLFNTFVLSKDHLKRVKDVVAGEATARGVATPPRCSSLVATLGLVWSCYQRAKPVGGGGRGRTCLLFPVDHRSRMKPPLPDKYFGNCVGPALATASEAELAAGGAGGLWTACAAVAAAIEEAVSGIGTERMDLWGQLIGEVAATGLLTVAGSPRFRVYELDFGFGRPAKVDVVSVAKTGAVAVAESRDGAGGIEVGVSLPPDGMDAFRKCFADAIAGLDAGAAQ